MPINRELWKVPFRRDYLPSWPCPTCTTGQLELHPDTLLFYETRESREARSEEDWEPDWQRYTFTAVLRCNNKSCKEFVTTCGSAALNEDFRFDERGELDHVAYELFYPAYFSIPLNIFEIPSNCPPEVSFEITKSFNLFFADPSAASNHLRTSIEHVLTFLEVKRYNRKNGGLLPLSLHSRISLYENQNKAIADRLFAIKWLGNAGSHTGNISKDDVLDAFAILEVVLGNLFVQHEKNIDRIVSKVNKKKGPLRSKRKRKS